MGGYKQKSKYKAYLVRDMQNIHNKGIRLRTQKIHIYAHTSPCTHQVGSRTNS